MKKLIYVLAVIFSTVMFSCGKAETTAEVNDTVDTVMMDTVVVDTVMVDTVA